MCGLVIFHFASSFLWQLASISVWLENYHLPPPPPKCLGRLQSINRAAKLFMRQSFITSGYIFYIQIVAALKRSACIMNGI